MNQNQTEQILDKKISKWNVSNSSSKIKCDLEQLRAEVAWRGGKKSEVTAG